MSKKKTANKQKQPQNPPKEKYVTVANVFESKVLAPMEREYNRALMARDYATADRLFPLILKYRDYHRKVLIPRAERVNVKDVDSLTFELP